jgi:hypothetical protein
MNTIILSLILLALTEAILKPLVTRLAQIGIKAYVKPAYEKLDALLTIPENWKLFVEDAESFVWETVIPEGIEEGAAGKLTSYLVSNFDLGTFLNKVR